MRFIDTTHQEFFVRETALVPQDSYHHALIYLLGLTVTTRSNYESIYIRNRGICTECLRAPWQTGTTARLVRLAFNLFNGFAGEEGENGADFTPYNLFDCQLSPYFIEALKIRYPSSFQE